MILWFCYSGDPKYCPSHLGDHLFNFLFSSVLQVSWKSKTKCLVLLYAKELCLSRVVSLFHAWGEGEFWLILIILWIPLLTCMSVHRKKFKLRGKYVKCIGTCCCAWSLLLPFHAGKFKSRDHLLLHLQDCLITPFIAGCVSHFHCKPHIRVLITQLDKFDLDFKNWHVCSWFGSKYQGRLANLVGMWVILL